ncbi:uncharacterized protein TNCV_3314031 [Trichonephila clavipes]|nr:uncharacterized protein TNCV_3314031 [Trichonephila clavipes]
MAPRICSGAFRTSPVQSLSMLTVISVPLDLRRRKPSGGSPSLDSPLIVTPHRTLNSCRGVISESDLLYASQTEILKAFLTRVSLSPKLPSNIKAGYLIVNYVHIPNPLRCFKCQRFGHSQNSCRGQLTCSRCAAVGHSSTDCTLEPKCINCSQPHTADSKLCPKWKTEKQIQEIKTNRNVTYVEARKLIVPQTSHTYSQAAKSLQ